MKRREFLKNTAIAGAAGAATLAAPAIAQGRKELIIVSTWPRDFPGLGLSAQRLAARIPELTEGRIQVKYFASGERVGAFDSFDEVASGNSQAYIAADYYWKGKHPGWAYFRSTKSLPATLRPTSPPTTTGKASTRAGPISPPCPSAWSTSKWTPG